ncbi:MAG: TIGR03118 family protein [Pseudonocardiales bacterium]|nr:TIGR03118 family protein [Actinomycetota bacterium]
MPSQAVAKESRHGHAADSFRQVNLVSDLASVKPKLIDASVINPWGISFGTSRGATTPLWVANQGSNTTTVYRGGTPQQHGVQKLLSVNASSPTGTVFNDTNGFALIRNGVTSPSAFLFNENLFSQDGTPTGALSGWSGTSPASTFIAPGTESPGTFYTGLALVKTGHGPRLLAVGGPTVDVFDSNFHRVMLAKGHDFTDPHIKNLAPYNVATFGNRVYVAYASLDGPEGALSVFTNNGRLIKTLVNVGQRSNHFIAPWGMAIAPKHWGDFGGDLLVGNVGDGRIHAYDPESGKFEGTLKDSRGHDIINTGLWGLAFGNGVIGTPRTLIFAAGIGLTPQDEVHEYEHGLVGLIIPNEERDD